MSVQTTTSVREILGDEAAHLLDHECMTIARRRLHLPGPDFVDRVLVESDRNNRVIGNLSWLFHHGRLSGTGYLSILPVDQGIEPHGRGVVRAEPRLLRSGGDYPPGD